MSVGRTREAWKFLAVDEVLDRDLNLIEVVQDVQLRQVQAVVPVDEARVLHHDQVQPAAAPPPPRRRAILASDFLEVHADVLCQESRGEKRSYGK